MAYVALRDMDVKGGRMVRVGELVPEAQEWDNVATWINQGYVAPVADENVQAFIEGLENGVDVSHMAPGVPPFYLAAAAEILRERKRERDEAADKGGEEDSDSPPKAPIRPQRARR
jgi:hypothetical protein